MCHGRAGARGPAGPRRFDALVDAPVSGGVARAGDGRPADHGLRRRGRPRSSACSPLLDTLARTAAVSWRARRPATAKGSKPVNQLLCGVHIAAAAEALAFAEALGLDPRTALEASAHGAAASFMLDDRGSRMLDAAFAAAQAPRSTSS